ncbi:MAG: CDP-alcohol phosphatidyltransferase family protein [Firmicutes bacterium]|nr:CDP-alcohol phosphatidyltransferase family protein [Bacillota bacterium]
MIGCYNYTVILTYFGLAVSVYGMTLALSGNQRAAMVCLVIAGLCDAFDGKVARSKKNRTEMEKNFGIQIDSLCDLICFGMFPAVVAYSLNINAAVMILFVLAGVIRLAYFNVTEEERQKEEGGKRKYYQGFPITSSSMFFPIIYAALHLARIKTGFAYVEIVFAVVMVVLAILFVLDIKVKKPSNAELAVLSISAIAVFVILNVMISMSE